MEILNTNQVQPALQLAPIPDLNLEKVALQETRSAYIFKSITICLLGFLNSSHIQPKRERDALKLHFQVPYLTILLTTLKWFFQALPSLFYKS